MITKLPALDKDLEQYGGMLSQEKYEDLCKAYDALARIKNISTDNVGVMRIRDIAQLELQRMGLERI